MIQNYKYEILTPSGFQKFNGIRKVRKEEYFEIEINNSDIVRCSIEHPFILDDQKILAYELYPGCRIDHVHTQNIVTKISKFNNSIDLYDIIEVDDGNIFIFDDNIITHNCDFLSSGHTVLEPEILEFYETNCKNPIEKRGIGGDLWIWKFPDYTKSYVVCADPARGDGEDYSGFIIMDVENVEVVAEYKGKVDTQAFGRMLVAISTEYNHALLVIDNKNIGWSTVQVALDLGYRNLYYSYKNDPYLDENIHLRKNYDMKNKEDMVPGLTTTTRIRPVLISKLEMYFREKSPIVYSKRLMNEFRVFMWIDGKAQAQRGYNDDLVMSMAMCLYIRDTALRMRQMGIELTKFALNKTHKTIFKPTPVGESYWSMNTGKAGAKENIRWLL